MKPTLLAPLLLSGCAVLAGCEKPTPVVMDQCMRREIFSQCMAALPKGPERIAGGNDWDEVVNACESAAYYQSKRELPYVKPECRW